MRAVADRVEGQGHTDGRTGLDRAVYQGRDARRVVSGHVQRACAGARGAGAELVVHHPGAHIAQDQVGGNHHVHAGAAGRDAAFVQRQDVRAATGGDGHVAGDVQGLVADQCLSTAAHIIAHHQAAKGRRVVTPAKQSASDFGTHVGPKAGVERKPAALVGEVFLSQINLGAVWALVDVGALGVASDQAPLGLVQKVLLVEVDMTQRLNANVFEHLAGYCATNAGFKLDALTGVEHIGRIEFAVFGAPNDHAFAALQHTGARAVGVGHTSQRRQRLECGGHRIVIAPCGGLELGLGGNTSLVTGLNAQVACLGGDAALLAADFGHGAAVDQVTGQHKAHGSALRWRQTELGWGQT